MLQGHNIICFSNDWEQDPLSKHHIMSRLAQHNRVLWINSIGMRRPTLSQKDVSKAFVKLKSFFKGLYQPRENLFVISPLVIPFHGNRLSNKINRLLMLFQVKYYQKRLGLNNPIFWTFLPNAVGVLGSFGEKLSIYYITDDFTEFTEYPSQAIAEMESFLIDKSNLVIASSRRLGEKKSTKSKNVIFVNHGVNYQHFAKALSLTPDDWPSDIKNIKHPVIGFYGEINNWLDLEMLVDVAKRRPQWSFVLLGRIAVEAGNISFLTDLPNVYWLGQKDFNELPAYCSTFDVALIPMKTNELTLSVNPLKLREYLAAGVPVVSAPLPEVEPYSDVVKFASNAEELCIAVEDILKKDRTSLSPALSKRVANESWDSKVEEISDIIEQALTSKDTS